MSDHLSRYPGGRQLLVTDESVVNVAAKIADDGLRKRTEALLFYSNQGGKMNIGIYHG